MQVLKCVKPAQNLIEFVFVFPMLIFLTLVMFEVALFWQDVNAVYNLNSEINAKLALVDNSGLALGDECNSAKEALTILNAKQSMISLTNVTFSSGKEDGKEPFALYKFASDTKVNSGTTPQITLWVDCRNPFEDGVTTQVQFYHKMVIIKASIPRFDKGDPIVIIPDNIFIASTKLNTLRQY